MRLPRRRRLLVTTFCFSHAKNSASILRESTQRANAAGLAVQSITVGDQATARLLRTFPCQCIIAAFTIAANAAGLSAAGRFSLRAFMLEWEQV
jgi:hypothetical protein